MCIVHTYWIEIHTNINDADHCLCKFKQIKEIVYCIVVFIYFALSTKAECPNKINGGSITYVM